MFVGTVLKKISLKGYIDGGLVDTLQIKSRHDALATEMVKRGMNHHSPIDFEVSVPAAGIVDSAGNLVELARRCPACRELQLKLNSGRSPVIV
jgi:hypothetical protein